MHITVIILDQFTLILSLKLHDQNITIKIINGPSSLQKCCLQQEVSVNIDQVSFQPYIVPGKAKSSYKVICKEMNKDLYKKKLKKLWEVFFNLN